MTDNETGREKGNLIIHSIFDDVAKATVAYTNVDLVSTVKDRLAVDLDTKSEDLILFCNNKYMENTSYIFQFETEKKLELKYCHLMK